jgi:hypothetical protein
LKELNAKNELISQIEDRKREQSRLDEHHACHLAAKHVSLGTSALVCVLILRISWWSREATFLPEPDIPNSLVSSKGFKQKSGG